MIRILGEWSTLFIQMQTHLCLYARYRCHRLTPSTPTHYPSTHALRPTHTPYTERERERESETERERQRGRERERDREKKDK